jgi:hypothetical protein
MGFWLIIGFIKRLWLVTTNNYSSVTLQITILHTQVFSLSYAFPHCCLVVASNSGDPLLMDNHKLRVPTPVPWLTVTSWLTTDWLSVKSSKMLLALASIVVTDFKPCWDPWPNFCLFMCFAWQSSVRFRVTLRLAVYRHSVRLGGKPLETHNQSFFSSKWTLAVIVLSDERMGLSFTIAAGPRQDSHSQVRVPWDSWPNFTASDLRFPSLEGQVPVFIFPRNRVTQLYPKALGYDWLVTLVLVM